MAAHEFSLSLCFIVFKFYGEIETMRKIAVLAAVASAELGLGIGALVHHEPDMPSFETAPVAAPTLELPPRRLPTQASITTETTINEEVLIQRAEAEANDTYLHQVLLPALGKLGIQELSPTDVDPNDTDNYVNGLGDFIIQFSNTCAVQYNLVNSPARPGMKRINWVHEGRPEIIRSGKDHLKNIFRNVIGHAEEVNVSMEFLDFDPTNPDQAAPLIRDHINFMNTERCTKVWGVGKNKPSTKTKS